jgi:hypothetical protein
LPERSKGQSGRRVGNDLDGHAVEVGQSSHVVVRVALEDGSHPLLIGLEHEGAGADDRVRMIEVPELLLRLAREDGAGGRIRQVVHERRVRFAQGDPHGMAVDHFDGLDGVEADADGRLGPEALERVLHIIGGHLAPFTGGFLWKRTPFRRVKTIVVGLVHSHFSARSGRMRLSLEPFCSGLAGEPDHVAID